MSHELTLAHSPDADDLVMWWPLTGIHDREGRPIDGPLGRPAIDTGRFSFRCMAADVEELNRQAIRAAAGESGGCDITAISAHAYPFVSGTFRITACGASMGEGYGPKVVGRNGCESIEEMLRPGSGRSVAVPGVHTTAFLTLRLLLGHAFEHVEIPFHEIVGAVTDGRVDLGLLIHEAQLLHEEAGLDVLADLGEWWGERYDLPLPLGLNVVRRDLDERFGPGSCEEIGTLLQRSVVWCREHHTESRELLLLHSEGREEWHDDDLVRRYLDMYVSEMTVEMGSRGRGALQTLLGEGAKVGLVPDCGSIDLC